MSAPALRSPSTADNSPPINFTALLQKLDTQFAAFKPPVIDSFRFELDGIRVEARRIAQTGGPRFLITAVLGALPFSIESSERRQAIITIVAAARTLPNVHFAIDHASKISVGGLFDVPQVTAPDFIFYPLMLFLQEARPFMRLIGRYL